MNTAPDAVPTVSMLLVEDEKTTLELLAGILKIKYPAAAIHVADNGRNGLELSQTCMPDLVITDLSMPEMAGIPMADSIRAARPGTKFIALTGDSEKLHHHEHHGNGASTIDYYIGKPVIFEELFAAIDACLAAIVRRE